MGQLFCLRTFHLQAESNFFTEATTTLPVASLVAGAGGGTAAAASTDGRLDARGGALPGTPVAWTAALVGYQ
ncbi:MAG: hypothetical protein E6J21_11165 [Chloroflexota bacterium]|nr:MAG: hypothetical protein E6J21_11165 [Chloroflexota bacterium]